MQSTRLNGKVLEDIEGRPMLWHVVKRASLAKLVDQVVVATSLGLTDDPIEAFCSVESIACYRGNLEDVLDRYYQAAKHFGATVIVRITADCPMADPLILDTAISAFRSGDYDYVSNVIRPTFPDGLDVEVFTFAALERTWHEAKWQSDREHVTTYMKSPARFTTLNFSNPKDLSDMRWTVDEPDDLRFVRAMYRLADDPLFSMADALEILRDNPSLININSAIGRNEGLEKSLTEDRFVDSCC